MRIRCTSVADLARYVGLVFDLLHAVAGGTWWFWTALRLAFNIVGVSAAGTSGAWAYGTRRLVSQPHRCTDIE
jgi:hypothetical protein